MNNLSLIDVNKPDKVKSAINELIEYKNNATAIPNITAESLGLGDVDNTSDLNKPISTAQQAYVDEVNEENVKLESNTAQTIDSDLILGEGKSLSGERGNSTSKPLIRVKNEGGYEAVRLGNKDIPLKLEHSMKDINDVEVAKNPKIIIKDEDGIESEDSLALSSDLTTLQTTIENSISINYENKVDKDVFEGAEVENGVVTEVDGENFINVQVDDMQLIVKVRSIADGALLRENSLPIKLASASSRGLMSKENVASLNELITKVAALEGQNARYLYTDNDSPTTNQIDAFAQSQGKESPYAGVAIVIEETYHVWHYYENDNIGWRDDGADTVMKGTNETLGVVIGSNTNGKIYIESDGSMSLVGFDSLTSRLTSVENSMIEGIAFASGTNNGTIKATITINGVATTIDNIPVKGLGSAAYHNNNEYATANHTHANYLTEHQDISGKENNSNKVSTLSDTTSTILYPNNKAVVDYVSSIVGNIESLLSEV